MKTNGALRAAGIAPAASRGRVLHSSANERKRFVGVFILMWVIGAVPIGTVPSVASAADAAKPASKGATQPRPFGSPEEAMESLASAVKAGDVAKLKAIIGSEGAAILESGDPIADNDTRERFSAAYAESHKLEYRGIAKAWIVVGKDDWPLPLPIAKRGSAWYFDGRAGKEELLNRRVGRNELSVAKAMLAYVDAQQEYRSRNPEKDRMPHYAQKFVSSEGKRDGLYFPTTAGEKPSPLGPLFDARRAKGYVPDEGGRPAPYHGYYYRILTAQGSKAPGGAYDYVVNGKMIGGFALVAYPAQYGNSGVMTFMVNHDGTVYEKNLGKDTAALAQKMTHFNPDGTWKRL
jgi:hypothetical protein